MQKGVLYPYMTGAFAPLHIAIQSLKSPADQKQSIVLDIRWFRTGNYPKRQAVRSHKIDAAKYNWLYFAKGGHMMRVSRGT